MEPRLAPALLHDLVEQHHVRLTDHAVAARRPAAPPARPDLRRWVASALRRLAERLDSVPDRTHPRPA